MSPGAHRPSIEERIAWTAGFTSPVDKVVLLALARSADFDTGKNAYPSLRTLTHRTGLSERTIHRALRRLESERWIRARRAHRHATGYDLALSRLQPDGPGTSIAPKTVTRFPWGFLGCHIGSQMFLGVTLAVNRFLGARFVNLGVTLAGLPVIRTRKEESARARAIDHNPEPTPVALPLLGAARSPPTVSTPPSESESTETEDEVRQRIASAMRRPYQRRR